MQKQKQIQASSIEVDLEKHVFTLGLELAYSMDDNISAICQKS